MRIQDKEEQSSLWHRTGMKVPHLKTSGNGEPPGNASELEISKLPCGRSLMIETAPWEEESRKRTSRGDSECFLGGRCWEAQWGIYKKQCQARELLRYTLQIRVYQWEISI